MLFSPTIGAAITAGYWFLWVRSPACRTTNAIDLRALDRHRDAAVTSLIPTLSCRSCRRRSIGCQIKERTRLQGRRAAVVLTGQNIDREWMQSVLAGGTPKVC